MILITGWRGYLGQHLLKNLQNDQFVLFNERLDITLIDMINKYKQFDITHVYHLASPTTEEDFEALSKNKIQSDIINGTILMINFCNIINAELVYFSTEGTFNPNNIYSKSKLISNNLIFIFSNKYKLLIIPRVYSNDRKKGLIPKLKNKKFTECELNKKIEYITIDSFIKQFKIFIKSKDRVCYFTNKVTNSISELKDIFRSLRIENKTIHKDRFCQATKTLPNRAKNRENDL